MEHTELLPHPLNKNPCISEVELCKVLATKFIEARKPRMPKTPTTIADGVVGTILSTRFNIDASLLAEISRTHQLSMAAENFVGELLERYLASKLEPQGWVWCSGSVVRSVDFIRPPHGEFPMLLLQVKNRDNSENSSSSAIREGTLIEKWFRTFSRSGSTNWTAFPDDRVRNELTENGFQEFVRQYLESLPPPC